MFEKENEEIIKRAGEKLLEGARNLTRVPEGELKRLIQTHCAAYFRIKRNPSSVPETQWMRNIASILYGYCSEFRRRKSGKLTYDPTSLIYRLNTVDAVIKLSDLVPHVVE